jgi:hypothetical protein
MAEFLSTSLFYLYWEAIAQNPDADFEELSTQYLDWNEAPDIASFYGRNQELAQLEQWILGDRF